MSILLFLLLISTVIFLWIRHAKNYWPNRGIPCVSIPLSSLFSRRREHNSLLLTRIYRIFKTAGARLVGFPSFYQHMVIAIDLELIKQVLVTNFESFNDRGMFQNPHKDPLSASILRARGENWKKLRIKLTPTFTSAKMRYMCKTVVQVTDSLIEVVGEHVKAEGAAVLQMRDICSRFTCDVIGLVAFGIKCRSLREPSPKFRIMGHKALACWNTSLNFIGYNFPRLAQLLRLKPFSSEVIDFYTKIVTDNIEKRELQKIRRQDFLDILIEIKNQQDLEEHLRLTTTEIVGQSFAFFVAGFETSSTTMSSCLFELAKNPDLQERARAEVLQCLKHHGNEMTFECLKDLKYLDQCVMETLRKYPVVPIMPRVAQKDFQVPKSETVLKEGVTVLISVYAIHHDPEFYPNPDIFDPERFTPEAIQARHPMAWLGFGAGPRVCLAERFGRMQVLIGLAMFLRNFRISAAPETPHELEYDNVEPRLFSPKGGIPLKVERI